MEIDNIKNYISDTNHNSFMEIANELYELTSWLNKTYPGYKEWFYNKQIKGCLTPNRNIIFVKNKKGKIIALSCLKKDEKERKICTLFVSDKYRKHGIGSLLLEESMRFFNRTFASEYLYWVMYALPSIAIAVPFSIRPFCSEVRFSGRLQSLIAVFKSDSICAQIASSLAADGLDSSSFDGFRRKGTRP